MWRQRGPIITTRHPCNLLKDRKLITATVKSLAGTKYRVAYGNNVKDHKLKSGRTATVKF